MNVVDLHPEDLLDKLERGALSAEEKSRLEAHLAGCTECRFEISVRADLADEALAPRARPPGPLAVPAPSRRSGPPRRSLPPRRALLVPALAAALVAGGALAAVVSEVVRARPEQPSLHRLESPQHAGGRKDAAGRRARSVNARSAVLQGKSAEPEAAGSDIAGEQPLALGGSEVAEESTTEVAEVPALPPAPQPQAASSPVARAEAPSVVSNHRGVAAGTRGSRTPLAARPGKAAPSPSAEAEPRTAAALFGAANRARRYGDTGQAVALYRSLQSRFPASDEARLSRATLATLELDRGDPNAALEGFDRYLEQGGSALSVEALVGRAVALQKLGKSSEELASWREIARRFPGTAHAKRAVARIAVLSGR